jgi:hypothetical protein
MKKSKNRIFVWQVFTFFKFFLKVGQKNQMFFLWKGKCDFCFLFRIEIEISFCDSIKLQVFLSLSKNRAKY